MGKWEMVRLGDIGTIITGSTPKTSDEKNYLSKDLSFFKPGDIAENTISLLSDSESFVSNYARSQCRLISPNSVLVTCIGIIGKIGITVHESTCNQQINAITPDFAKCDSGFLAYAISRTKQEMNNTANAAVVPIINKSQFSNIQIPLPPLPIQKKIADILDRASTLIEKRKVQIGKLDMLVKSRFVEMFGDPVTNPMGWDKSRLRNYIVFLTSGSRGWSEFFSNEGEIFLTIKNVKNSRFILDNIQYVTPPKTKEAQRTRVQDRDLLISITADLGRTAVVTTSIAKYGAYINQHLSLVRLDMKRVDPIFISYYLESQAGKRQFEEKNQVGVKSGLNFDAINSLEILVPPIDIQARFADFVQAVDKSRAELQRGLDKLEFLYRLLIQKCFNGEVF